MLPLDAIAADSCPAYYDDVTEQREYVSVGERFSLGGEEPAFLEGQQRGSRVNVRTGPGTDYEISAYGLVGEDVLALDFAYDRNCEIWFRVRFPASQHEGWIHTDLVRFYYARGLWD
ncbi:MAG: SH3 domain-containing protein [Cyanobacteria bacterium P01_G01_bin.38]